MSVCDAYVALGDSMSIDKYAGGPGLGAASLLYRNRDDLYPPYRGRDLATRNPTLRFSLEATDGLTSRQLERQLEGAAGSDLPTLVTLSIGGNDMLDWLYAGESSRHSALAAFDNRARRILQAVRNRFPLSVILYANIYDPSDGSGILQSGENFTEGIALLDEVNSIIADVSAAHGAHLVDVHSHFRGHGMRHDDPTYEHFNPHDPTPWTVWDIEPNARGASEIRALFWDKLIGLPRNCQGMPS